MPFKLVSSVASPIFRRQLLNGLVRPRQDPGRENRHLKADGVLSDLRDRRDHALFQPHIRCIETRLAACGLDLIYGGSSLRFVVINDVDMRALLGEKLGSGPANASSPAGYQRLFVR